ncbi:MAG: hypothetical protein JWP61_1066 [Friedmanniella sp.]|nr:hypothetical protein [Friedmanniella sp.]
MMGLLVSRGGLHHVDNLEHDRLVGRTLHMVWFSRYRRGDRHDLAVGDVIKFQMLFQSRDGFLVKTAVSGRVTRLDPAPQPGHVEGLVEDRFGITSRFTLTGGERLYVARHPGPVPVAQPGPSSPAEPSVMTSSTDLDGPASVTP